MTDREGVNVGVKEIVEDTVGVTVAVVTGVWVAVAVIVTVSVGVCVGVNDGVIEIVGDKVGVCVGVGVGVEDTIWPPNKIISSIFKNIVLGDTTNPNFCIDHMSGTVVVTSPFTPTHTGVLGSAIKFQLEFVTYPSVTNFLT